MIEAQIFFDRHGHPMTMEEWAGIREQGSKDQIFVAREAIGPVVVSTIWLGIDVLFGGREIFETMTFGPTDGLWDSRMMGRYATEGQAMAGHLLVCWLVRSTLLQLAK